LVFLGGPEAIEIIVGGPVSAGLLVKLATQAQRKNL
jgi:hypothetical protein